MLLVVRQEDQHVKDNVEDKCIILLRFHLYIRCRSRGCNTGGFAHRSSTCTPLNCRHQHLLFDCSLHNRIYLSELAPESSWLSRPNTDCIAFFKCWSILLLQARESNLNKQKGRLPFQPPTQFLLCQRPQDPLLSGICSRKK